MYDARIFNIFERLEPDRFPGTDIGLAIVKRAVEPRRGSVGLESRLGEGSRFGIELSEAWTFLSPAARATNIHGT